MSYLDYSFGGQSLLAIQILFLLAFNSLNLIKSIVRLSFNLAVSLSFTFRLPTFISILPLHFLVSSKGALTDGAYFFLYSCFKTQVPNPRIAGLLFCKTLLVLRCYPYADKGTHLSHHHLHYFLFELNCTCIVLSLLFPY